MTFLVVFCRRASRAVLLKEGLGVTSHCFLRAVARRPVSATRSLSSKQKGTALKRWTLLVDPFSSLKVRLPCDVSVKALDPHGYPDADRVFVELLSPNQAENVDDVQVQYDKALKQMVVVSENVSGDARIVLVTPVKFGEYLFAFQYDTTPLKRKGRGVQCFQLKFCLPIQKLFVLNTTLLQSLLSLLAIMFSSY